MAPENGAEIMHVVPGAIRSVVSSGAQAVGDGAAHHGASSGRTQLQIPLHWHAPHMPTGIGRCGASIGGPGSGKAGARLAANSARSRATSSRNSRTSRCKLDGRFRVTALSAAAAPARAPGPA